MYVLFDHSLGLTNLRRLDPLNIAIYAFTSTVFVNYNEFSLIFTNKFFLQNLHSVMYGVIYVRLFDYLTTNLNNLQRLGFCDLNMLLPNFRNDYQSLFAVKSGSMSSTCFVFLFIPAEKLFIFLKLEAHIQHS